LRAKRFADKLNAPLTLVHFGKIHPGGIKDKLRVSIEDIKVLFFYILLYNSIMNRFFNQIVGDVAGKVAIVVDDMADTCNILGLLATALIQQGAVKVLSMHKTIIIMIYITRFMQW
jgi:phosphoribosylpyrophosphate synthetase